MHANVPVPASLRFPPLGRNPPPASIFTATQWDTAEDKAKWARHFLLFCAEGFPPSRFTKSFYNRLSMCFGHIAWCDLHGFWGHFFTTTDGRIEFLDQTVRGGGYGSPAFTYSDVERELARRIVASGLIGLYETARRREIVQAETAELRRLQAKYQPAETMTTADEPVSEVITGSGNLSRAALAAVQAGPAVQLGLF